MTDPTPDRPSELPPGQAERLSVLLDAIGPNPLSDAERRSLTWLAGFEATSVDNIAAVIFRARERSAAVAVRRLSYETAGLRLEAERLRGQLVDLCEQACIAPGDDPHAALLADLWGRTEW